MKRSSGILLPISSLPSKYGIGCFSKSAYDFIDWLKECGQTYWQILPLCPTSYGDSPYQTFSTFAGNPYFISLEDLIAENLLTEDECQSVDFGNNPNCVDYQKLYKNRYPLLKIAFKRCNLKNDLKYLSFIEENQSWLEDYSLFMAIKDKFQGKSWLDWNEDIKLRKKSAIDFYKNKLSYEIEFQKFLQYKFYNQWNDLKSYANQNGIQIIGDIPIYVALDSVDTWANPKLFQLNDDSTPIAVAGCPPDGFSATGQLWGNPLYDWQYHRDTNYKWWIARLSHCFNLYDVLRIDHFRGFDEYYSIPYGSKNAINGHWEKGPSMELFNQLDEMLGKKQVIAEDLGFMTDTVRRLVKDSGFPNMKVLEFAFDSRDTGCRNDYLPHNYDENCVAYTGTHDNQTIVSWFNTISKEEQYMAREYLHDYYTPNSEIYKSFIALILRSKANVCIIPIQDYLGLDDVARINKPSTIGDNWKWRLTKKDLSEDLKKEILKMSILYGRFN
ncbi:MAG: 4-alpha-glucanotransferase [Oscillospiraceae bacterium]